MENRCIINSFPYVSEDIIKGTFEPNISKIKRILIENIIDDDHSSRFVLLNIDKQRHCSIGIILDKADINNDDHITVILFPRDIFSSDDNGNTGNDDTGNDNTCNDNTCNGNTDTLNTDTHNTDNDDNTKHSSYNNDKIQTYNDDIIIEKPTRVLISTSYVIEYINKTCTIIFEYFLENSVRLLKQKINNIGGIFNNDYDTTKQCISFRSNLSKDESQYFIDEVIKKENEARFESSVFKISSSITNAILNEANKSLNKQKHIDIDLVNNEENKTSIKLFLVPQDTGGTGGSRVWDASHFLAQWIHLNEKLFHEKSVIELGAGLGLPGLSAASLKDATAKVALTDVVTEVLDNLELNIEQNQNIITAKAVEVLRVDWFDDNEDLGRYDIVLIADVIYTSIIVDPLIVTIEKTFASDIYVCMPTARMGASEFLNKMKERGFTRKTIQIPNHMFHLCGKQIKETLETYIYHFKKEKNIIVALPSATRKNSYPNYFIAIRLKSIDLKRMVEDFQERYINGKFINTRTPSNKMHLTYFVIRLDGEDVDRAAELFMSCDLDKLMTVKSDLLMGNLTFFGNQVIKIEMIKDDIYKKLDDIGRILHDKFVEHGFIKKESQWKWEPHATIAKISADRKNFKRLKYSKDMLEGKETAFSSFPVRLSTIDLLQMNDVDEDGYYKKIATKTFVYTAV